MDRTQKFTAGTLLLLAAPSAFAYLDPGTGSMLIQGLIAAIAMAGVTARLYWHRILVMLGIRQEDPIDNLVESNDKPAEH